MVEAFSGSGGETVPGGVLLDHTATLVGTNLSELRGATYDPATNQLVFLGEDLDTSSGTGVEGLDMDYFFTAVQAVYGSAVPPYVTLDPAAKAITEMTDTGGDGDGILEPSESGSFTLRYQPLWNGEGGTVTLRFVLRDLDTQKIHDFETELEIWQSPNVVVNGVAMETLVYRGGWANGSRHTATSSGLPTGIVLDSSPFQEVYGFGNNGFNSSIASDGTIVNHYPVTLSNSGSASFEIESVQAIPSRQHRRFGGRVDGTKAGWVMYEADRIMKCLAVGYDPIADATYDSTTIPVTDFQNLLERAAAAPGGADGNIRMWFMPEEVTLKRHLDEKTGRASILFDTSKVELLTEASLSGTVASPNAGAFADHFTDYYDEFADIEFTVLDPSDPSGATTIDVKIFDMLEDVMEAVSLARFLRDNGVPLDMWWLNSWEPPTAFSPRSVATAYNEIENESQWFLIHGGVDIPTPNEYVPDPTASNVAAAVLAAQPDLASNPESDLDEQAWETDGTAAGDLTAVAATSEPEEQDGNIVLGETDLAAASVGELPLALSRFYQSSWLGKGDLGPGWRNARFQLEFSRPSWFDEYGLMEDSQGNPLSKNAQHDTGFRSGIVRVVDLAAGGAIEFASSLDLTYRVDSLNNPEILIRGLQADGSPNFHPLRDLGDLVALSQDPATKIYTFTTNEGHEIHFDSEGRVLSTSDKYGNEHVYTYDPVLGRLERIEDDEGQKIEFAYVEGKLNLATLTKINTPHAAVTESVQYTYYVDGPHAGCLETVTAVRGGNSVKYLYNERCQLVSKEYYDQQAAFVATVDLKGRAEESGDARGNTIQSTFTRDEATNDRITITSDPLIDPSSGFLPAQQRFDDLGRIRSVQTPTGATTTYGYTGDSLFPDLIQPPIEGRDAIRIERDPLGRPTKITDPSNVGALPVELVYNGDGLLEDSFDEIGRVSETRYTANREVDHVTRYLDDGTPVRIDYDYDPVTGYLETITNPENETVTLERDSKGRILAVEDATGVRIEYEYDAYGRLWKVHDPRMLDPVVYTYDDSDRIAMIVAPNGTTEYDYDQTTGRLSFILDPLGRRTRYDYFANGDVHRVTLERDLPDGTAETLDVTEFGYDRFGNLTMVDPSGAAPIYFTTDEIGRGTGSYEVDNRRPGPPRFLDSDRAENGVWTNETDHIFVWGAPESDSGIEGYSWAIDLEPDEIVDVPNGRLVLEDVAEGQQIFRVKAKTNESQSGETTVSFWSEEATFELWVDATAPSISGLSLNPPDVKDTTPGSVELSATVSDSLSGLVEGSPVTATLAWSQPGVAVDWSSGTTSPMTDSGSGFWSLSISEDWATEAGRVLHYRVETTDKAGNAASAVGSELIEGGKAPFLFFTR